MQMGGGCAQARQVVAAHTYVVIGPKSTCTCARSANWHNSKLHLTYNSYFSQIAFHSSRIPIPAEYRVNSLRELDAISSHAEKKTPSRRNHEADRARCCWYFFPFLPFSFFLCVIFFKRKRKKRKKESFLRTGAVHRGSALGSRVWHCLKPCRPRRNNTAKIFISELSREPPVDC